MSADTPNPDLKERLGEDPARFLGLEDDSRELILARIRGIFDSELLDAYYDVERMAWGDPDRDGIGALGRKRVILALNERRVELRDRDESELDRERSPAPPKEVVFLDEDGEIRRRDEGEDKEADSIWRHEACESTDVKRESEMAWFCRNCEQRTNRVEEVAA